MAHNGYYVVITDCFGILKLFGCYAFQHTWSASISQYGFAQEVVTDQYVFLFCYGHLFTVRCNIKHTDGVLCNLSQF